MIFEFGHSLLGSIHQEAIPASFNKTTTRDHVFGDLREVAASGESAGQFEIALQIQNDVTYAFLPGDRQSVNVRAAKEDCIGTQRDCLKAIAAAADPAVQ